MKKMGLVLALLSSVSMTVLPVAPSYAAAAAPKAPTQQVLVDHAARGNVAILSQAQMNTLAASHPTLHAKLLAAYQKGTVPSLTASEKKLVRSMTAQNLDAVKAGDGGATALVIVLSAVLLLLLWQPVVCKIFPWALGCVPVAVVTRG